MRRGGWKGCLVPPGGLNTGSCLAGSFPYHPFHVAPFLFHVRYQLKLGPGPFQVMVLPVYFKVGVPLQIVGEEPHAAFQGHKLCAGRQEGDFRFREAAAAALQEALCEHLEQGKGKGCLLYTSRCV